MPNSDHHPDEKDARTTGEFSAQSGPCSEKDFKTEAASNIDDHHSSLSSTITAAGMLNNMTDDAEAYPASDFPAQASNSQVDQELGNIADEIIPTLPGWRFGLLGLG